MKILMSLFHCTLYVYKHATDIPITVTTCDRNNGNQTRTAGLSTRVKLPMDALCDPTRLCQDLFPQLGLRGLKENVDRYIVTFLYVCHAVWNSNQAVFEVFLLILGRPFASGF